MTCPRCNSDCPNMVNFCPNCGFAFDAGRPKYTEYSQPQYQQYPQYYLVVQAPGENEANISFVCGIISLFAGFILGIIAIVMGKKAIRLGSTDSKARTGIILGWISIAVTAVGVMMVILFMTLFIIRVNM